MELVEDVKATALQKGKRMGSIYPQITQITQIFKKNGAPLEGLRDIHMELMEDVEATALRREWGSCGGRIFN